MLFHFFRGRVFQGDIRVCEILTLYIGVAITLFKFLHGLSDDSQPYLERATKTGDWFQNIQKDLNCAFKTFLPAELISGLYLYLLGLDHNNIMENYLIDWPTMVVPDFMRALQITAMRIRANLELNAIFMILMSVKPIIELLSFNSIDFLPTSHPNNISAIFNKTVAGWDWDSMQVPFLPIVVYGKYTKDSNVLGQLLGYWAQVFLQGRILISCSAISYLIMIRNTTLVDPNRGENSFSIVDVFSFILVFGFTAVFFLGNLFL